MASAEALQSPEIDFGILVVLVFIAYILIRFLRTMIRGDKYFESREKEAGQPKLATIHSQNTQTLSTTALFTSSLSSFVPAYLIMIVGGLLWGISNFSGSPGGIVELLIWILWVAFFMVGLTRNLLQPIRKAQFYEDHFRIAGRKGLDKELNYSDISNASFLYKFTIFLPLQRIFIGTRHYGEYVIWGNPRNKKLGTDLHSWLSKRVGGSYVRQDG